ncbi:hypothetical protein SAMN04488096_105198 [Mesonia phycicola]|uniref:DUF6705 domain-containing protein n=1 Tax=Mesonia phycicola TaxID=579105 RepID=A0A1M6EQB8_9FLAO|nr:DUF6705 family protein [Mesonia phycicola]SHI87500.1 hypothetical protein SAMN04488096_105198 [Mesonia phycicola]
MKYIYIITICLLMSAYSVNAQNETIVPIENWCTVNLSDDIYYFKDVNNYLDKFVGVWVYSNNNTYLKLEIIKETHQDMNGGFPLNLDDFEDYIVISMQYMENGIEKYNSLPLTINRDNPRMSGNNIDANNTNKIKITYAEPSLISCERIMQADLFLEFLGENPNQLQWIRVDGLPDYGSPNICPSGVEDDTSFLIPANLILAKQ